MTRRFIAHTGNDCPVPADTTVAYLLSEEVLVVREARAGDLYWGESLSPDGVGRITHYAVDRESEFARAVADFVRDVGAPPTPPVSTVALPLDAAVAAYNRIYPSSQMTVNHARVLMALLGQK